MKQKARSSKQKSAAAPDTPQRSPRRRWGRASRPPVTAIRDPKAPKKGGPIPARGVGSRAATSHQKLLTAHGKTLCLGAWCRALGITRNTLRRRLRIYTVSEALSPKFREIAMERGKALGFRSNKRNLSPEARERLRRNMLTGKALAALRAKDRKYTANGETHTLAEWSKILGVKHHTLYTRVHHPDADLDKALSSKGNLGATRGGEWADAHPGFNEYRRKWRADRKKNGESAGKRGKRGGGRG